MIELRPYQANGVQEIRQAMRRCRRVLYVLATGGGKTVCFSYITYCAQLKKKRIYILVHREQIVQQISNTLSLFDIKHGLIQPGRTPTTDMVQVGMVQTCARRLDKLQAPDMVIFDEAHHAVAGEYTKISDWWFNAKILGVTATPERLDGQGLCSVFDEMIQGPPTPWLIANNFLADFDYYAPPIDIDLSAVKVIMGDYQKAALSDAVDKPKITGCAIQHYNTFLPGKKAVAFCVSVAHSEHVAADFNAAGIPASSIDGSMSTSERKLRVDALKSGAIKILTSCDLISEGFDVPSVSGAILLRPSKSLSMVMQQWGRALRLKEDGSNAIFLDHVGHVNQFGTPKTPRAWSLDSKKRKGELSGVRQCKSCFKAFEPDEMVNAVCSERDDNQECLFHIKSVEERAAVAGREIEHVSGDLVAFTDSPAWAKGINILTARGEEWGALLHHADTHEKLKLIGKIRGYHYRWATHQWNNKRSAA